jgi:signal transduction histidine kinase
MTALTVDTNRKLLGFLLRARRWVILAMLLSLHAALITEQGGEYQRIWFLVHFGLFLLWQPFVATDQEIKVYAVLLLFTITAVTLYFLSGWMIVTWLAILIGILGGKVFTQQAERRSRFYLVSVFYLFCMLLLWAIPVLLLGIHNIPEGAWFLITVLFPLTLLLLLFLPFNAEEETHTQVFDFFYSLVVFQLIVALGLGSIALMRVTDNQYFQALLLAVLGFAAALIALAVLWGPRTGFGGLRTYFSRYLMSVGMPFELWMRRIAELAETDIDSTRFLQSAMGEIASMPWIVGGEWQSPDGAGGFGTQRGFRNSFRNHELEVAFYTEVNLSPALFLHVRLLAQVIGEFYEGKRREQVLRQNAYMQAVHETGARLTHDIKNLLQSLYALTSLGVSRREKTTTGMERRLPSAYEDMLERQLPQLTKRLQSTLDKLQNPALGSSQVMLHAGEWWKDVLARYRDGEILFAALRDSDAMVPATLFDTVLENCLENARRKKLREPLIEITVNFYVEDGDHPRLVVADSGSPVPELTLETLFRAPVQQPRDGGMGIGLYQAARQAEQAGYVLAVAENAPGWVCFELRAAGAVM